MARRQFQDAFPDVYFGSETKNFGSLADKAKEEEDVTVTGAASTSLDVYAFSATGAVIVLINSNSTWNLIAANSLVTVS